MHLYLCIFLIVLDVDPAHKAIRVAAVPIMTSAPYECLRGHALWPNGRYPSMSRHLMGSRHLAHLDPDKALAPLVHCHTPHSHHTRSFRPPALTSPTAHRLLHFLPPFITMQTIKCVVCASWTVTDYCRGTSLARLDPD